MNCKEIHSKELDNYGRFNIHYIVCYLLSVNSVNEHKCLCETCDLEAVGDSEEGQSAGKKRRKRNHNYSCTYRSILHKTQVASRTCWWSWRCYYEHKTKVKYIREFCCRPLNGFSGYITITGIRLY